MNDPIGGEPQDDGLGDGGYGYDLAALLAVPPVPPPRGFEERWRTWFDEARAVDPDPLSAPIGRIGGREVSVVDHVVADGLRLRGWFAGTVGGVEAAVGIVHGHGYGGRAAPGFERVPDDAVAFFPLARGLGSLNAGVGAPTPEGGHVLFGIESVDAYALGRCAVDLWHAASALHAIAGSHLPLYSIGESFGGGIGALALPWDDRVVGATLIVPSFGQYDIRLALPCEGSGERVRHHVAEHPGARDVLRFFDASTAAAFARVPVRVECALRDRSVPPPGQFAVANAVALAEERGDGAELELDVQPAGHAEYPGIDEVHRAAFAATRSHVRRSVDRAS
ncbi:cephalosporin-C deacetylase [Labedella gwakjiensis]|uniref:Acetylesterase n=1 Tax=Labedella gwakjiensis TaxID=390269 RepID=A0A2P8GUI6_9MICO|nr:acetylxylan esterase [Labedella gwakjiensis]PSL37630.1 cephalosporin-C deacetylase [Labedella gwakjiensis]RUQ87771.1 acetylesterase [Labedella gwakjiensis]